MSNPTRSLFCTFLVLLVSATFAAASRAQCLDWAPGYESSGLDAPVQALTVFDDGNGAALYIGGSFTTAGSVVSPGVARWNGTQWSAVGSGLDGAVHALQVFDDGNGAALYAGGFFKIGSTYVNIARWNGTAWATLGNGLDHRVRSMTVHDDGTGPALYVGGDFTTSTGSGLLLNHVARWNGSVWSGLWTGVGSSASQSEFVYALASYDDGGPEGPVLYVGGYFDRVGSNTQYSIARWDGTNWSEVGSGLESNSNVLALLPFDDGSGAGERLFVGGYFHLAGGQAATLAMWDGSNWSVPAGIVQTSGGVHSLAAHDDGSGPDLYLSGTIALDPGPQANTVRWDGAQFTSVGAGIAPYGWALSSFDDGGGSRLYVGGPFSSAGSIPLARIARWDGSAWSGLSAGLALNGLVESFALFDDGSGDGSVLHAAGSFSFAGQVSASCVARWDGSGWSALGGGVNGAVHALINFDDGTGSALYAGGDFTAPGFGTSRWNGSTWSALANSPTTVAALCAVDHGTGAGPQLYAARGFVNPFFPPPLFLHRLDGTTWETVPGSSVTINALCAFNDGTGSKLYTGGGYQQFSRVSSWDGASWTQIGGFANKTFRALAVFDDGSGARLYAAGEFTNIDGTPLNRIARWSGTAWEPLGLGLNGNVLALTVFDDGWGGGPKLYAGGEFTTAGGNPAVRIARWNGTSWSAVGSGISGTTSVAEPSRVQALASFNDLHGSGRDLYAGGLFTIAGGKPSIHIAKWEGCGGTGTPYCFGDGSLATACPCSNTGSTGHGCAHSQSSAGALLSAAGVAHPDSIVLTASGMLPSALTIYLQGDASAPSGIVFGDGVRCAAGHLLRIGTKNAVGGTDQYPGVGDLSISARSAALGAPIPPNASRYYQAYYRDPNLVFCALPTGSTFNVTNGIRIVW